MKKQMTALSLAFALFLTILPVQAAVTVPESMSVYLPGTKETANVSIFVEGLSADTKLKKKVVSISNTSVAKLAGLSNSSWMESYDPFEDKDEAVFHTGQIYLKALKAGTTKVSVNLEGETSTCKVKVLEYSNPLKSISLSGFSTSFASKFKKSSFYSARLPKKTVTGGKLKATAKSGWLITGVSAYDGDDAGYSHTYFKGKTSVSLTPFPR